MSTKNKNIKIRLNLQIDKDTLIKSNILREKYHINISSFCREAINNLYNKLNKKNYEQ